MPPLAVRAATLAPGEDRFWVVDAFVGYRLPNRRGLLSLNADNLLDERLPIPGYRSDESEPVSRSA